MSIRCMSKVWESSKQKGSKLLLLLAIADFADDGGYAYPSMQTLAEKIRMSRNSVNRLVGELVESKELYCVSRRDKGRSNRYVVTIGLSDEQFVGSLVKAGKTREEALRVVEEAKETGGVSQDDTCTNPEDGCNTAMEQGCNTAMEQGCNTAMVQGCNTAMVHDPSLTVTEPSPNPGSGASEKHRQRLRERFGSDIWSVMEACANRQPDVSERPRGWETGISEAEFAVCQRVAELWGTGKLPTWSELIDRQAAGAAELLRHHDGDLLATLTTIDRYHQHYVAEEKTWTVAGPQSLVNVIPPFIAQEQQRKSSQAIQAQRLEDDPQYRAFAALSED
jgi:hypothetical protein